MPETIEYTLAALEPGVSNGYDVAGEPGGKTWERKVKKIKAIAGSATVTVPGSQPVVITQGQEVSTSDKTNVSVGGNGQARVAVTFTDNSLSQYG